MSDIQQYRDAIWNAAKGLAALMDEAKALREQIAALTTEREGVLKRIDAAEGVYVEARARLLAAATAESGLGDPFLDERWTKVPR